MRAQAPGQQKRADREVLVARALAGRRLGGGGWLVDDGLVHGLGSAVATVARWTMRPAPVNATLDEAVGHGYYLAPWMEPPDRAWAQP